MLIKHCPEIAELYITPCNLGFYESLCLGARVVQDTGQAGALIVSGATVGITPQGLYYMEEHDLPRLYNRNAGGRPGLSARMDKHTDSKTLFRPCIYHGHSVLHL